jgi:hypothetical protein
MAKQIARLLRTDMMADMTLPALAQLLQKKGRGKDTILAHITPNEARRLKRDGGSGSINPDTGLPEFEEEGDFPVYDSTGQDMAPAEVASANPEYYPGGELPASDQQTQFTPNYNVPQDQTPEQTAAQYPQLYPGGLAQQTTYFPEGESAAGPKTSVPTAPEGMSDKTKDMLLKGALGLGTGLAGAYAGRKSAQQAQAAKNELAAIGAPYQQKGKELQDAALRGELTPAGQKQIQAARAQLAQGVEKRGGVGAAQAATQLAGFKQQLLDTQYNYGLKVAQIGDSYAANAIRLGLTQDKELASMMGGFTSAAGAFLGGQPNVPVK